MVKKRKVSQQKTLFDLQDMLKEDEDVVDQVTTANSDEIAKNEAFRQSLLRDRRSLPHTSFALPVLPKKSSILFSANVLAGVETEESGLFQEIREVTSNILFNDQFSGAVPLNAFTWKNACFVPGKIWGDSDNFGPRNARVMIINKMAWEGDIQSGELFSEPDMVWFLKELSKRGLDGILEFYLTNLVKFFPPNYASRITAGWLGDSKYLLQQELRLVQPDFILTLGTDASKALLGSEVKLSEKEGVTTDYRYLVNCDPGIEKPIYKSAKVVCVSHPRAVQKDVAAIRQIEAGIARFRLAYLGEEEEVGDLRYEMIDTFDSLLRCVIQAEQEIGEEGYLTLDMEWTGIFPGYPGAYPRTLQFSWKEQSGVSIKLCNNEGKAMECFGFKDGHNYRLNNPTVDLLGIFLKGGTVKLPGTKEKFKFKKKRPIGHFFVADLPWMIAMGLDIRELFSSPSKDLVVPKTREKIRKWVKKDMVRLKYLQDGFKPGDVIPAWYRTKYEGGADTGLQLHAIEETGVFKLENAAARYTNMPRYDKELSRWRKSEKLAVEEAGGVFDGYGECPDEIIVPYGCGDVDATLRLFHVTDKLLDSDHQGNCCREAFWESMIAFPAALEIHCEGIRVDTDRTLFLTENFLKGRNKLELNIAQELNWPGINVRSVTQVREVLFGEQYNRKVSSDSKGVIKVRPEGAKTLNIKPILDTSKPPRAWKDLEKTGKDKEANPGTDQKVLKLLINDVEDSESKHVVELLRDHRLLDQALKTVLRPPQLDEEGNFQEDEDGNLTADKGILGYVGPDGRVRPQVFQTKETGRWSMKSPNLHSVTKKQDLHYSRILGEDFPCGTRSIFQSEPDSMLVAADITGAELAGMAIMSGDKAMLDHVRRTQLPETDPEYFDIHANIAVRAFKLNCESTKVGLKEIGKIFLRDIAKTIIFGLAYGRGAKSIALEAKQQGVDLSVEEAELMIKALFEQYPGLPTFFDECERLATTPLKGIDSLIPSSYICSCFGRYRRFSLADQSSGFLAENARQAKNFPIQSLVASIITRACSNFCDVRSVWFKETGERLFKFVLQIHDELIFEVPNRFLVYFVENVIPDCMIRRVPIYPSNLDGTPKPGGPYFLSSTVDIGPRWGEFNSEDTMRELGLPTGVKEVDNATIVYSK